MTTKPTKEAMRLGHFIGKLYNLAEKKAEASDLGLLDPDAMELFQARFHEVVDLVEWLRNSVLL